MAADGNFGKVFRATMAAVGMPWPDALGDDFEKVTTVAGELVAARAVGKNTSALRAIFLNLPRSIITGTGVDAAAATSVVAAAGTVGAAYVGAVLGSLLVATWDTYGPSGIGKLQRLITDTERAYGTEFAWAAHSMIATQPELAGAAMTRALHIGRAVSAPRAQYRGVGGRGGGGAGGRSGGW